MPNPIVVVAGAVAMTLGAAQLAWAGGGPESVLVLYNADVVHAGAMNDPREIAEHYRAARSIPRSHLVPVHGLPETRFSEGSAPQTHTITVLQYEQHVLAALDEALAALPHPEDIDYLVVVRGLPYRVDLEPDVDVPNDCASLTAMLGVYRANRVDEPSDFLYDEPHFVSIFPPFRRPSIENPYWYGGRYVSGDYPDGDPVGTAANKYVTSTGVVRRTALEGQAPSFTRSAPVPVPLPPAAWDFGDDLFLVTRLDGFDYSDAHDLVERGAGADGTFPARVPGSPRLSSRASLVRGRATATILCMSGLDVARRLRDSECRFATAHLEPSFSSEYVAEHDTSLSGRLLAAYFTGSDQLATHFPRNGDALTGNTFAPGAIASNLTSNAGSPPNLFCDPDGDCPPFDDQNGQSFEQQSSVGRLIRHGVTGAHAAVAEPFSHAFPGPGTLLLYTFGYNLAESFFFAQPYLHWQDTYFGDPLASPYAERPVVTLGETSLARGERLEVTARHPDGVARIRVYVDGVRLADVSTSPVRPASTTGGELALRNDARVVSIHVSLQGLALGTHEILAVATACNALVERPGWPEPLQLPRSDVQGWTAGGLEIRRASQLQSSGRTTGAR